MNIEEREINIARRLGQFNCGEKYNCQIDFKTTENRSRDN